MKKFIICIFILPLIIGCSNQDGSTDNSADISDSITRPDSEVLGATIYLYKKDQITTKVIADKILKFEINDSTMAYVLDIDLLDSLGMVTTHIVGDSGIIKETDGFLKIYGNVKVVTDDSTILYTDYLIWDSRTNRIRTDAFVRIERDDDIISGWGLDADNRLTSIKILDRVTGEITNPEKFKDQ